MILSKKEILDALILIVDDQEANVRLLERLLGDSGYSRVTSTMRPQDVSALYREHRYDLILLDLQMPLMDGFEVMASLMTDTDESYLPVIVLTAQPAHKLRALQAGAKDFISKPFDLLEVKTRIHNMLEVRLLYNKLADHNELLEVKVRERTAELAASELRFRRFTELASDWYWEQNATGAFTQISGPVIEMIGLGMSAFLGDSGSGSTGGWNESERLALQEKIAARQPFIDFGFSRKNGDGSEQYFRVSGEPMFDSACHFSGYRGVGVEVRQPEALLTSGSD